MNRIWRAKPWHAFALALSLLVGILFGGASLAATRYTGTTTSDVNIRSSPSSKATKIGTIKKGVKVTLVGSVRKGETANGYTADMHFFQLSTGGYVAQAYVGNVQTEISGSQTAAPTATPTATPTPRPTATAEEVLDLDEPTPQPDPGGASDMTTVEPTAANAEPTEEPDSIPLEETDLIDETAETIDTGLTVTETTTPAPTVAPASNALGVRMSVTTSNLNVRSAPTTAAKSVRRLSNGTIVRVTTHLKSGAIYNGSVVSGSWYMLADGNFVSADYLKSASTSTVSSANATQQGTKSVTTATAKNNAVYYSNPSTLAFNRGTMRAGDTKDVSASYKSGSSLNGNRISGNWYKLSNGYYVRASDVTIGSRKTSTTTTVKVSKTNLSVGDTVIAKTTVNVRSGPGTSYSKIGSMSSNTQDTVTSVAQNGSKYNSKTVVNGWVKLSKMGGYVQADYLKYAEGKLVVVEANESFGTAPAEPDIPIDDIINEVPEE